MGVVDTSTSQGRNFGIRSPFRAQDSSLERYIRGIQLLCEKHQNSFDVSPHFPKNCCLGSQNGSRSPGLEKLLKIVNYQNCQKIVLSLFEKVGGH
jgi:hypothetical protein